MTRTAVEAGFEYFLDEAIETAIAEFSVARALRNGSRGPTDSVVDGLLKNSETLHRRVVRPELETYRRQTLDQFGVVLDYADSGEPIDHFRDELLETGAVAESIRTSVPRDRREQVKDSLVARHRELGEAVEPLLDSSESDFWVAARKELTREQAEALVSEQFPFTGPLRRHRDAFEMATTVDASAVLGGVATFLPASQFEVVYTDEAIRAMYRAEQSVIQDAFDEIDQLFD